MGSEPLSPAYVLHRRPYRETSVLVELLTARDGRLGALARGARRRRSTRAAVEPFVPLLVAWRGGGDLATLTSWEASGGHHGLAGASLHCGFYVNELILRLVTRGDGDAALFALYLAALAGLAAPPTEGVEAAEPTRRQAPTSPALENTLRRFEMSLLDWLGYGVDCQRTISDEPIRAETRYRFTGNGFAPEAQSDRGDSPLGVAETPPTEPTLRGATVVALGRGDDLPGEALAEAKRLLRARLRPLLGAQPVRSRALFK